MYMSTSTLLSVLPHIITALLMNLNTQTMPDAYISSGKTAAAAGFRNSWRLAVSAEYFISISSSPQNDSFTGCKLFIIVITDFV